MMCSLTQKLFQLHNTDMMTALLKTTPNPTDADIDTYMSGNLCRCGTYDRIRKGIHRAAESLK